METSSDLRRASSPNFSVKANDVGRGGNYPNASVSYLIMSTSGDHLLSRKYIEGVYVPSGLLVLGCLIVKREWLPFAVAASLVLGGWKVYNSRM